MKKGKRKAAKPVHIYTYSALDVLMASATEPMPAEKRRHQLTRMYEGLNFLETAPSPTPDDWCVCSDAVNLMETLVEMGAVEDSSGLLMDAITALANAGRRHKAGQTLRLDALGIKAVRCVLEDYADVIEQLPQRTIMQAHRRTEKRIHDILAGRKRPHDVEIINPGETP